MQVNGRMLEEHCEDTKEVASKFGITVVCDEKDEADVVMPAGEDCENMKVVASKVGKTVVCDEEV